MSILVADTYVWYNLYKGKYDTDRISQNHDRFASTLINVEELLSTHNSKQKVSCVLFNAINYTVYKPKFYSALLKIYYWILDIHIKLRGNPNFYPPIWYRWLYEISQPKLIDGFLIANDAMVELSRDINSSLPIGPFLSHENDYLKSSEFLGNLCKIKWWRCSQRKYRKETFERWHQKGVKIRKKRTIFQSHLNSYLQNLYNQNFIKQNDDYTKLLPKVEEYLCQIIKLYNRKVVKSKFAYPSTYHWPKKRLLVHFAAMTFFKYLKGGLGKPAVTISGKVNVDENDINDLLNFCYHKPGYIYFIGEKRWKTMYDQILKINHPNFPKNQTVKDIDYFK